MTQPPDEDAAKRTGPGQDPTPADVPAGEPRPEPDTGPTEPTEPTGTTGTTSGPAPAPGPAPDRQTPAAPGSPWAAGDSAATVQFAPPAPDHASPHAGHPDHASPYPDPAHVPPPGSPSAPVWPVTTPPKSRRGALWVSLALVLALLLCGGGGVSAYLLLRNAEGSDGAPDPASAVTRFLTAVYTERNATAAASTVCREARDQKKITAKVNEVKGYSTTYRGPRFAWTNPTVADQQKERALVRVKLTMTTEDEKASEQQLTFTAVKKTGWWVCEVSG